MAPGRRDAEVGDEELLEGVRRRDLACLRLLVERHGAVVVASAEVAARRAGREVLAEDLAAAAFRSLWRAPPDAGRSVLGELLRCVGRSGRAAATTRPL